jgi:hypothetical protein
MEGYAKASNFEIVIGKNSDGFGLKLAGDVDATSAYEMIHAMRTEKAIGMLRNFARNI